MRGRPTLYTPELAARICSAMLDRDDDGRMMSLKAICAGEGMPSEPTVYRWLAEHAEFREMYTRAREERAHLAAEDVIEIADGPGDPHDKRVRIDARKWYAGKLNARHYGDRQQHEHTGKDGGPIEFAALLRKICPNVCPVDGDGSGLT